MTTQLSDMTRYRSSGFTLVEIMVSTALVVAIMVLMLGVVNQTQRLSERSRSKTTQFQAARNAFDSMARRLSQATLNTYWRAQELTIGAEKAEFLFRRQAELQFISGPTRRILQGEPQVASLNEPVEENYPMHCMFFHAPVGFTERVAPGQSYLQFRNLNSMLSAIGYFVEFGDDFDKPGFLQDLQPPYPSRLRYRLMEMVVPAEKFNIYFRPGDTGYYNDPKVLDESGKNGKYYLGLVNVGRRPIEPYIRPFWMKEALKRVSAENGQRFAYARPMAENVIALIILPKVPVRDRLNFNTSPPTPDPEALELAPFYEFDSWRVLSGTTEQDPATNLAIGGTKELFDNRSRDNLLPPIVQVTMVAIDEPSAIRMNLGLTNKPKWTRNLFKKAEKETDYEQDIRDLEEAIKSDDKYRNINYRIFTTDVIIRGSKWSRDPKDKY